MKHREGGELNRMSRKEASAGTALLVMALIAAGVVANSVRQLMPPKK
jgi:hypothetical protein